MADRYSVYEAKAKFSEVMRKVRSGKRVIIAYRGEEIAVIAPIPRATDPTERWVQRLVLVGGFASGGRPPGQLKPLVRKPGALARFLESRE